MHACICMHASQHGPAYTSLQEHVHRHKGKRTPCNISRCIRVCTGGDSHTCMSTSTSILRAAHGGGYTAGTCPDLSEGRHGSLGPLTGISHTSRGTGLRSLMCFCHVLPKLMQLVWKRNLHLSGVAATYTRRLPHATTTCHRGLSVSPILLLPAP